MIRFKNAKGVDAILAHNSLLEAKGKVFWGLWLKDFENRSVTSARLSTLGSELTKIYVADTTHKSDPLVYVAEVRRVVTNGENVSPEYVPHYYNDEIDKVPIWFELSSKLIKIDIDSKLTDVLGVPTIYFLEYRNGHVTNIEPQREFVRTAAGSPGYLLHLTDIHLGEDHGFSQFDEEDRRDLSLQLTLTEVLRKDLELQGLRDRISGVVISGDIVTRGAWSRPYKRGSSEISGLDAAKNFLNDLAKVTNVPPERFFVVPGNHDVVRQVPSDDGATNVLLDYKHESGFRSLREQFCNIYKLAPLNYALRLEVGSTRVMLGMLNSAYLNDQTDFVDYGFVGDDAERVFKIMGETSDYIKVLVLHHHVLPVYEREVLAKNRSISLTLDAAAIMRRAQEVGVNIVLHGHQHFAKLMSYASCSPEMDKGFRGLKSSIRIVAGGSAGARLDRLPPGESNTYGLLDLSKPKLPFKLRRIYSSGRVGENW